MYFTELSFRPNWASPPGDTIVDILQDKNISIDYFANSIGESLDRVTGLLSGQVFIDSVLAERLEVSLGTSKSFWITRESQYRKDLESLQCNDDKAGIVDRWLDELPLRDMVAFGWIPKCADRSEYADECLRFFNVPSVHVWRRAYVSTPARAAFRTSSTYDADEAATAAWLRQGEREANQLDCKVWDKEVFKKQLTSIRALTRKKNPHDFLPELQKLCSDCGVAVAIVRTPSGCRASGATKFLTSTKALLMLSFRYLSDDHFWFTFFHEAAHLLLHGQELTFFEVEKTIFAREEQEANDFSANFLIPLEFQEEMVSLPHESKSIMRFARKIGVSPGIVVGQLQFRKILGHSEMNRLKARFQWA